MPMKDSTKTRINAGIMLGGLALAAVSAICTGPASLPVIGGIIGFLSGMAGNQSQAWLKEKFDALPPPPEAVFRNHDIRDLIKTAVATVIRDVIGKGAGSGTLDAALREMPDLLDIALDEENSILADLGDSRLPEMLTAFATNEGGTAPISIETWETILNRLPDTLWKDERTALARALHARLPLALWNLVKLDSAKDGPAFAAVEMLYLSRILKSVEGAPQCPDLTPLVSRVLHLVSALDERTASYFQRVFGGVAALHGKLDEIAAILRRLEGKLTAADPLQRYFCELREHFSSYDNVGLPVAAREGDEESEKAITIRDLFVPPHCADHRVRPAELDAAIREGKTLGRPFLPTLQQPRQRTVLLADPGMGKSTVIQWLIATLAADKAPEGAPELQGVIPFPFILCEIAPLLPADVKRWDWDALLDAFRRWNPRGAGCDPIAAAFASYDALFRTRLNDERAFFLIDGLDEIGDPSRRRAIRDAIWEGFKRHADARFLVTSRVVGYGVAKVEYKPIIEWDVTWKLTPELVKEMRQKLLDAGIPEDRSMLYGKGTTEPTSVNLHLATLLYLAPFDDSQQRAFAEHWYIPRMGSDQKGAQRAREFIAAVHLHRHTRVIGRVPNLLYLLALLYRHQADLPNGRVLVYEAISKAYLETIPAKRRVDALLTLQEKEKLLAIVGIEMHRLRASQEKEGDGDILVSREQLGKWLGQRFADAAELDRFLSHIAHTSGLLLPRGEDEFGFAHLSFQEFYAACHLQKDFERIVEAVLSGDTIPPEDLQLFEKLAVHPAWHEPLLFLVERLRESAPFTGRIIKWMFPQLAHDDPAKGGGWMRFSAAQLLATLSIDPEVALDDPQRETMWKALWTAHIAAWDGDWNIAPYLIGAGSTFQPAVLRSAASLQPEKFHLLDCTAVSDLTPLRELGSLRVLNLIGCTAVSDLKPLSGLGSLQRLWLGGCTAVSDLTPLSGLGSLQGLVLHGCTAVSDLTPLSGLGSLRSLVLDGCTAVSYGAVAALKASLPDLTIIR